MKPIMACGCAANAVSPKNGHTVPSCAIHDCLEIAPVQPSLSGRKAQCGCGKISESSLDLPFFTFRGEGSSDAIESCKHCRYHEVAHAKPKPPHLVKNVCDEFTPHGAFEFDGFYCGHTGWD